MTFPDLPHRTVLFVCLALGMVTYLLADTSHRPIHDEVRYADYAIGLSHGVFGVSWGDAYQPGYANLPLYPMFVAFHVALSDALGTSLDCVVKHTPRVDCPVFGTVCGPPDVSACSMDISALVLGQSLLFAVAMYLTYLLLMRLTGDQGLALLAIPGLFLAMHFVDFVEQVMTENLVLPLFTGFLLTVVCWWQDRHARWLALAGVLLGLMMLTRPEYLYVLGLMLPVLLYQVVRERTGSPLVFLLCVGITLSPWLYRNQTVFGQARFVDDSYSGIVLSERVAFNRMRPAEWLAGFVYWLPDFGDEVAPLVLPESSFRRFQEYRPDSFSSMAATGIYPRARAESDGNMTAWLLRHEVLPDLPRHVLTTLPLLWRGLFIGKYWGIIGLVGFLLLVRDRVRTAPALWLGLMLVPVYLLCLRAGVSASMPRYSVPLMPLYAMGWAFLLTGFAVRRMRGAGS